MFQLISAIIAKISYIVRYVSNQVQILKQGCHTTELFFTALIIV